MQILETKEEKEINYYLDLLFSDIQKKRHLGKIFIWGIGAFFESNAFKTDLVFVKIDAFFCKIFSRLGFFLIPEWVTFAVDLSKPLPKILKSSGSRRLSENLRKMRKYKLVVKMKERN